MRSAPVGAEADARPSTKRDPLNKPKDNSDDEARYQRTRLMVQYLTFAADVAIRLSGEIIRILIR
jgi:hypothetical protein